MNSYCVKQSLFDGYSSYLAGAFSNPEVVKRIIRNQDINCVSLFSTQEEADTRIILHVLHADKQFWVYRCKRPNRYQMFRYRCFGSWCALFSTDAAHRRAVVIHAVTGCDTTSAFFRIGKRSVYKILKTSPGFASLTNADLEATINAARHAVSLLYDPKGKFKSCHHDLNMCLDLAYKQQC